MSTGPDLKAFQEQLEAKKGSMDMTQFKDCPDVKDQYKMVGKTDGAI